MTTTEPTRYELEGVAVYEHDDLDRRVDDLIDRIRQDDPAWFDVDATIGYLVFGGRGFLDETLELIRELADRETARSEHDLSPQEGRRLWRERAVADLAGSPDRYAEMAGKFGWPDSPRDLDDGQLEAAQIAMQSPDLLDELVRLGI